MNLTNLLEQWDKDTVVDPTNYRKSQEEALRLHAKYLREYVSAVASLRGLEGQMKKLRLEKHEHYMYGPAKARPGWKMPASGKILKTEVPTYVDADEDVLVLVENISALELRVECAKLVIRQVAEHIRAINNLMQHERFKEGQY
jgi:hypothetical protein